VAGTAIMLFAALVLASASPAHRQAALRQGAFPALTLAAIAVHGAL
jgi:putative membrane protein